MQTLIYDLEADGWELEGDCQPAFLWWPQQVELEGITDAFLEGVKAMASRLNIDHRWLLAVMDHESNLRPDIVNKTSRATGLIQFIPSTAKALGTTVEALQAMDGLTQLQFVEKYLAQFKPMRTATDVAAAVFYPKARGDAGLVIGKRGQKTYDWNARLDRDNKGFITMVDYMRSLWKFGRRWGVEMSDVDGYLTSANNAPSFQALLDLSTKILRENPKSADAQAAFSRFAGTLASAAGKAGGADKPPTYDGVDYRSLAVAKIKGAFRVQSDFSPTLGDYVATAKDTVVEVGEKAAVVAEKAGNLAGPVALAAAAVAALLMVRRIAG